MKNEHENKVIWDYYQTGLKEVFKQNKPRHDYLFNRIKKIKLRNPKIMELGFGDGYLLNKLFLHYKKNIFGADICKKNIDQMRLINPKIDFGIIENGITNFDDKFNVIIASEVLEHMTDEELFNCVSDTYNKLENYGYFIITVPYKEKLSDNKCICPNCSNVFHKWGHKQIWYDEKISSVFMDFQIVSAHSRFFNSSNNLLGYFATLLRNILHRYCKIKGGSYVIILQKSDMTEEYYRLREIKFGGMLK